MRITLFKTTDNMTLEELIKYRTDWQNKIDSIKRFEKRHKELGTTDSWSSRQNRKWIIAAQRNLDELIKIIQLREMALP